MERNKWQSVNLQQVILLQEHAVALVRWDVMDPLMHRFPINIFIARMRGYIYGLWG